jgi:Zn-dependent protease/predicted transcriptional regulator
MNYSFRIGRIFGVDVLVHFTFPLVALFFGWLEYQEALRDPFRAAHAMAEAARTVGFFFAFFGCVLLHEYGHILMARRFGVPTRDVTLLPIGGVARLERIPERPREELLVALAGPAVNVVIAVVLLLIMGTQNWVALHKFGQTGGDWVSWLMRGEFMTNPLVALLVANVVMIVFNMIPAFPMDGGRVLRALLSMKLPRPRATRIAASIGKAFAVLMALTGIYLHEYLLVFTGAFVWIGATRETEDVELTALLRQYRAGDVMLGGFHVLSPDRTLQHVLDALYHHWQMDFPIVDAPRVLGVISRAELLRLGQIRPEMLNTPVSTLMRPPVLCDSSMNLADAQDLFAKSDCPMLCVMEAGELIGILTPEVIERFLRLQSAGLAVPQQV